MKQLNPYLHFDGNCREAMEFYSKCLGGELKLMTIGDSPMASQMPPGMKNGIMHSTLEGGGVSLMASDMMDPKGFIKGNTISLCIVGSTKSEIEKYFAKLSAGGKVIHPLEQMFFGTYGDLTDKFGIHWMFEADLPKPK
jgi:PhnB protein